MPTSVPGGSFWQSDAASATDSLMHPPLALAGVSTGVQRGVSILNICVSI